MTLRSFFYLSCCLLWVACTPSNKEFTSSDIEKFNPESADPKQPKGTAQFVDSVFEFGIRRVKTVRRERHGLLTERIHGHHVEVVDQSTHRISVCIIHTCLFRVPEKAPYIVGALQIEGTKEIFCFFCGRSFGIYLPHDVGPQLQQLFQGDEVGLL